MKKNYAPLPPFPYKFKPPPSYSSFIKCTSPLEAVSNVLKLQSAQSFPQSAQSKALKLSLRPLRKVPAVFEVRIFHF